MMNLLRSISAILIFVASVNAQSACKTPVGETGICIPAKECSIIVNILMDTPKPLPQKALDYLKRSHCGTIDNVHYACCSARHRINSATPPPTVVFNNGGDTTDKEEINNAENANVEINNVDDHPNLNLLPLTQCGRIENNKVSYGDATAIGEFPWMAMLQYQTSKGLEFQCGGALISSRYVLTAAHCVTGIDDILVSVRLGEYNRSSELDCEKFGNENECADAPQDVEIEEVVFHPEYNNVRFANDVALLRLNREVNISSDTVQAVCLPVTEASQRQTLDRVIISGWGLTENNQTSDVLLKATLPVLSNDECQRVFRRSIRISNSQICAGGENMIDSCKGDSGGPLIFPGRVLSLRYIQYGIISAGANSCGSPSNFPGIYAKVSFYIKWILDQLKP